MVGTFSFFFLAPRIDGGGGSKVVVDGSKRFCFC